MVQDFLLFFFISLENIKKTKFKNYVLKNHHDDSYVKLFKNNIL